MCPEFLSMWDADGGAAARCYAEKPYGHYAEEVYPLSGEILDALGGGIRVLDIGAGPGHCAVEFYRRRPRSAARFALLDVGRAMLDIAVGRLAELGVEAESFQRSLNLPGWADGLGRFDAVLSNNAIFHVRPARLPSLYETVYGLLNGDGLLLNHQAFGHECPAFADALEHFPDVLSPLRGMAPEEAERAKRMAAEARRLNEAAERMKKDTAQSLTAAGREAEAAEGGYASLHLPVSHHIAQMSRAGFAAGCIWRKMESAVLVGIKGSPFPKDTSS